jgi:hypothetical protein
MIKCVNVLNDHKNSVSVLGADENMARAIGAS